MNPLLILALTLSPTADPVLNPRPDIVQKLRDLQPNQAIFLGKADVVGEFNEVAKKHELDKNGPNGRDFSIKMVWAEDRKRVLFCGANHQVPHRLNDVWEFDLGALTWNMLYAPDNNRDYTAFGKDPSDVEFRNGIFITKRGGPGIIGHTWWGLTYDPDQKQMLFLNTWVTEEKKGVAIFNGDPATLYTGPPLWAFDPATKKWQFRKTENPGPKSIFGGMLEYIPDLKGTMWHTNDWQTQASWKYDFKANTWKNLNSNADLKVFEKQAPSSEQVGYYDSKRKLIIVQRHKETFHYDPKSNVWKKVLSPKDEDSVPYGHDAFSPFYYDVASGRGLLLEYKTNQLWSYNPDKIEWTKLTPAGDKIPTGGKRLVYTDPVHNVLVVIDGRNVWAYRYGERN